MKQKKYACLIIFLMFFLAAASSPIFAYSDIGLLKTPRTFSCFLLLPADSADTSLGIVYNQDQNEKLALEVSLTSYNKVYPFTKNVARIRVVEKYKLSEFGPAVLTVLAGAAIYYAPGIGAGLAADAGGIISVNIFNNFAAALTINGTVFKDGLGFDAETTLNFAPGFLKNTEIYCGFRVETSMVGFTLAGASSGKIKNYVNAGIRIGI